MTNFQRLSIWRCSMWSLAELIRHHQVAAVVIPIARNSKERNFAENMIYRTETSNKTKRALFQMDRAVLQHQGNRNVPQVELKRTFHHNGVRSSWKKRVWSHKPVLKKKETASLMVEALKGHINGEALLVEAFPGEGLVTGALLSETGCQVVCWEPRNGAKNYIGSLQTLQDLHPQRLKFVSKNLFSLPIFEEKLMDQLEIPSIDSQEKEVIFVIPGNLSFSFLTRCMHSYKEHKFPFNFRKMNLFLLMCVHDDNILGSQNKTNLLLKLLFDHKTILKLPSKDFGVVRRKKFSRSAVKDTSFHLIHAQPKYEMFDQISRLDIQQFSDFVYHMMKFSHNRLIPHMETMLPGIGLEVIKNGFTMMDVIKSVPPEHFIKLFQVLKATPNVNESPYFKNH